MRGVALFLLLLLTAPPVLADTSIVLASWYEDGERMANGEPFDPDDPYVVAHPWLPFGTTLRVTNPDNGERLILTVKDRGPYVEPRKLDLTRAGADRLGFLEQGIKHLAMEVIYVPGRPQMDAGLKAFNGF